MAGHVPSPLTQFLARPSLFDPLFSDSMSTPFETQLLNPFSAERIRPGRLHFRFSRATGANDSKTIESNCDSLLAAMKSQPRSLIVGPHGTGKSTLLQSLLPKLQQSYTKVAMHRLSADPTLGFVRRMRQRSQAGRRVTSEYDALPSGGLLVVDGWEQLPASARWRLTRFKVSRGISLLATSHRAIAGWDTLYQTRAHKRLVRTLANELLLDTPHEIRELVSANIMKRRIDETTNIRELWFELYDLFEDAVASEAK